MSQTKDVFPNPQNLSSKLFWFVVIPLLAAVVGGIIVFMITEGKLPAVLTEQTLATSTPNVADIFYRLNQIDRPIDQRDFLNQHNMTRIVGTGSFITLGGSREDKSYRLYLAISTGVLSKEYIVCTFENIDEATEGRIDLLKRGQKIDFVGTFSNSSEFGSNAWVIQKCEIL